MNPPATGTVDYGLDAPGICRAMLIAGSAGFALLIISLYFIKASWIGTALAALGALAAAYGFFMGGYMLWSSRIGKICARERLLDQMQSLRPWTGAETVLDVGCGRGLMLVGAAKRLTTGKATGIDIWNSDDQANNSPEAAGTNAFLEGVSDKINIQTADARTLPFADGSADVIVSHWVIHNLSSEADRIQALDEMWRVLKIGGVIVLADIRLVPAYADYFMHKGASKIIVEKGGLSAAILGVLSGGSFRPQAVFACRS